MKARDFVENWQIWGLPAFAGIFAPWQDKLTQVHLISDFFQPELNLCASVFGPLACMIGFGVLATRSRVRRQKAAIWVGLLFFVLVVICFSLSLTVGIIWHPSPVAQPVVWVTWITIYLSMFCALGVTMVAGMLAVGTR